MSDIAAGIEGRTGATLFYAARLALSSVACLWCGQAFCADVPERFVTANVQDLCAETVVSTFRSLSSAMLVQAKLHCPLPSFFGSSRPTRANLIDSTHTQIELSARAPMTWHVH